MKERVLYLDNLKGFAILLVILGHAIQYCERPGSYDVLYKIIYSFHMPLFMTISGYFGISKNVSVIPSTQKRFKRLMIPYLIFGIIGCLARKGDYIQLLISPDSFLWFLWDLFFISLLTNIIVSSQVHLKVFSLGSLFLLSFLMLGCGALLSNNDYNIKSICWLYNFYILGAAINTEKGKRLILSKPLGLLFLLLFGALTLFGFLFGSIDGILMNVYSLVVAYLGVLSCFFLFASYFDLKTPILKLGQSTLGIYAIHQSIIKVIGSNSVLFSFIIATLVSYLMVLLIRRTKYLKFIIGE